ncbi:MAG: 4-hydroxyphenylacetate decarboxylase small subunit [Acidaminococcaceae bacterium]|nr:4-hydroxyphenylacetate decarboxylase small subunit [Acidaminococcaceae bacterium]
MFDPIAKCKCCKCFVEADENNIGICDGFKKKDWTYGDLKAVYCEQFTRK